MVTPLEPTTAQPVAVYTKVTLSPTAVKVMVEKLEFVMPPQDGAHLKDRFRAALLGRA